jgi:hypothetical protein
MICKYCSKTCSTKLSKHHHEIRCPNNENRIVAKDNQYTKAKMEGRTINLSEETLRRMSIASKRPMSNEQKEKLKVSMRRVAKEKPESYSAVNINGRTKKIKYCDVLLDGSWEVEFAKWCDSNSIEWIKNLQGFNYVWNNQNHTYYPDFFLPALNIFVEVKGYIRDKDLEKWKVVHNLKIIKYQEILKIKKRIFNIEDLLINH